MPPESGKAQHTDVVRRALVADRSPAVASALGEVLSGAGWGAQAFSDADGLLTALDAAHPTGMPALLVLDLHLPRLGETSSATSERPPRSVRDQPTGFELLPELRLAYPGLALLLLVEFARLETAVKAVRLGAGDVLVKPVPDERLITAAEEAVLRQALLTPAEGTPQADGGETDASGAATPSQDAGPEVPVNDTVLPLSEAMASAERELIRRALDQYGWARTTTAQALGINRATLYKKMRSYGLDRPGDDWPDHGHATPHATESA